MERQPVGLVSLLFATVCCWPARFSSSRLYLPVHHGPRQKRITPWKCRQGVRDAGVGTCFLGVPDRSALACLAMITITIPRQSHIRNSQQSLNQLSPLHPLTSSHHPACPADLCCWLCFSPYFPSPSFSSLVNCDYCGESRRYRLIFS